MAFSQLYLQVLIIQTGIVLGISSALPTPVLKVMNQEFSGILYVIRGDNITVTCELPGVSGPAIYQWTGRSPGFTNLTFHNIQPSEAGVYNCTVHPANGDQQTTEQVSLTVVVLSAPSVPKLFYISSTGSRMALIKPQLTVIRGTSFSLKCSGPTSAHARASYRWLGSLVSHNGILNFTNIDLSEAGTYTCLVENSMRPTFGNAVTGRNFTKIEISFDIKSVCRTDPKAILLSGSSCATYYECQNTSLYYKHECVYPKLFSTVTKRCETFENVSCGIREEPMAPCQYEQNLCDVRNTSCFKCPHRLPSCIGKPSGKQAFPGRLWKPDYILCYKDRTLRIEKCPVGYFHPALQKCTEAVTNVDAGEYCTAHPTDVLPAVDNCAQYYKCSDRITSLGNHREECSYPDLFSSESLSCESFMDVDCSTRAEPQAPCEYDQNLCNETDPTCVKCSLRYPSCVGLADGNQTFPERVGKPDYITCFSNRTVAISKCVDGYFDPVSKKCIQNAIHTTMTSHTETAITTTGKPTIPPSATRCAICAGPPESCQFAYYEDYCQPPNHYCINNITNLDSGVKLVDRRCGNVDTCFNEWYINSSDDDKCQHLSDTNVLTYHFTCTYCCTKDSCNVDLHPKDETLYPNLIG